MAKEVIVIDELGELTQEDFNRLMERGSIPYTKRNKVELFELNVPEQYYADGYRKPNKPNKGLRLGSYKSKHKNKAK